MRSRLIHRGRAGAAAGCLAAAGLVLLLGCSPAPKKSGIGTRPAPGGPAGAEAIVPSLSAGGGNISLPDFLGQVVLLDFWATWSPICREDLPELDAMYQEFEGNGFSIIGLAVDRGPLPEIQRAVQEFGLSYPVGLANEAVLAQFGGIRPLPTRILLDKSGRVHKQYAGVVPLAGIRSDVEALLAE